MGAIAIEVDQLWKKFHRGEFHDSLRDFVPALFRKVAGWGPRFDQLAAGDFWALRNVSFQVPHGQVLGIIGANGAGKSTLLKLLSRIIKPNRGRIRVDGRLRALIEVAAGFHPDLTGRENIYLNGAILGMGKREIDRKFDEIVEFSGIEAFLDTPVKRYSSGMYARLGFAVAAHLDPEILVVDEVLAVGDAEFQQKCLGKMSEVSHSGRTVLFVSHNMGAVQFLCNRCLVLDRGEKSFEGSAPEAIDFLMRRMGRSVQTDLSKRTDRGGAGKVRFTAIEIQDARGTPVQTVAMGKPMRIRLAVRATELVQRPVVGIAVKTNLGQRLFRLHTGDQAFEIGDLCGERSFVCEVPSVPLVPGSYHLSMGIADGGQVLQDSVDPAAVFEVVPSDVFGTGQIPNGPGDVVFCPSRWSKFE